MFRIVLIDPRSDYGRRIAGRISSRLHPFAELIWSDPAHSSELACDFRIIQEDCRQAIADSEANNVPFCLLRESGADHEEFCFTRQFSVRDWLDAVIRLSSAIEPPQIVTEQTLHLLHSFSDEKRHLFRNHWLQQMRRLGRRVFILPLMPHYDWPYDARFGPGPDLAGMILQIEAGQAADLAAIGHLFQQQNDGCYLVNPGGAADDLFACSPHSLLQLARLFRSWLRQKGKDSAGLIECKSIPLRTVAEIGMLCDCCHFHLPDSDSFGDRTARANLAELLAAARPNLRWEAIVPACRQGDPQP